MSDIREALAALERAERWAATVESPDFAHAPAIATARADLKAELDRRDAQATLDQEHLTRVVVERAALEAALSEARRDIAAITVSGWDSTRRELGSAAVTRIDLVLNNDEWNPALTSPSRDSAEREESHG